ncbi:hypothetical protein Q5762_11530 [Streptomyces sp. P9(2023)]|uniref:hypothetical protein n=1 Tax=Streptomyces sp. P9(2023) TaxID=3064394 RepID=UPI0028F4532E|nr:hypothetical protein [Streptomyces sp. P9(2023)]MDT9688960.1 hypothetical protein [Streptomyces sp. P9(2023)]
MGGDRPQEFRAYLRSVTDIGISLGALLAGWVVQVGTHTAYELLVVGNAVAFAASAAFLVLLPPVTPLPAAGGSRWGALRDRPYLVLTALDGIMAIQFKVLTVAIPLWLVEVVDGPRWLISGSMLVNTVIVIACQVPASRSIDSPRADGAAYRRSGVAFLVSCGLISLCAGAPGWAVAVLLLTSGSVPVSRKRSGRACSSRSASHGGGPAGTSWERCSPSRAWRCGGRGDGRRAGQARLPPGRDRPRGGRFRSAAPDPSPGWVGRERRSELLRLDQGGHQVADQAGGHQ